MKRLSMGTGLEKHASATRREEFLAQVERIAPWAELRGRSAPHYSNCRFRHLLERHGLGEKRVQQVRRHLER
jgi:hypothetical protein